MPERVYIRSKKVRENMSKARRKWIKENPEEAHNLFVKAGRIGGVTGEKSLKNLWENNREMMMGCVYKNCTQAGRQSNSLKNLWENNREEMIKVCSEAGKIRGKLVGGIYFKQMWESDHDGMLENCVKGCKNQQKLYPSPLEVIVREFLDKLRIKYEPNVWFPYEKTKKEADIVIDKLNLIIECDGWGHDKPEEKDNDELKTEIFNKLGYKVLRLKGPEIRDGSFKEKVLAVTDLAKPKHRRLTRLDVSVNM